MDYAINGQSDLSLRGYDLPGLRTTSSNVFIDNPSSLSGGWTHIEGFIGEGMAGWKSSSSGSWGDWSSSQEYKPHSVDDTITFGSGFSGLQMEVKQFLQPGTTSGDVYITFPQINATVRISGDFDFDFQHGVSINDFISHDVIAAPDPAAASQSFSLDTSAISNVPASSPPPDANYPFLPSFDPAPEFTLDASGISG